MIRGSCFAASTPFGVMGGLDPPTHSISYPRMRVFYVYILASKKRGTLYIGVTNDIARRVYEHRTGTASGFTRRYGVFRLVYFEDLSDRDRGDPAGDGSETMEAAVEDRADRERQSRVVRPLPQPEPVTHSGSPRVEASWNGWADQVRP
jgi:hypothetical protein